MRLSLISHMLSQAIKIRLAYRLDFVVSCLSAFAYQCVGLIVIYVIFRNTDSLGNWNQHQVLFIYGMSMMSQNVFNLVAESFWFFPNRYIMNGEFDRLLLRPIDPLIQVFFENINFDEVPNVIVGLGIVVYASHQLGIGWTFFSVLWFMVALGSSILLLVGLFLGVTATSFWFEDRVGLGPPIYNLMAFGNYPISIFSKTVQFVLTFLIPFGFMAFYPALHFILPGGAEVPDYMHWISYATPLVGCAVFGAGFMFWRVGIRAYRSTGS